jgi:hypothetical protein
MKTFPLMKATPEQQEKVAQAYLQGAHDKRVSAKKRMMFLIQAKRWRGPGGLESAPAHQIGQITAEKTPAGEQSVTPGSEHILDAELAKGKVKEPLKLCREIRQRRHRRRVRNKSCIEARELLSPSLQTLDDPFELGLNLFRYLGETRIINRLHGGHGIDGRDFDAASRVFLHDDIAGDHGADLVLELERAICQLWITGA